MTTTLTRRSAFPEFADMRERVERMFEDLVEPEVRWRRPAIDVAETADAYIMRVDVPGLAPDDITVTMQDNLLKVRGEYSETSENEDERVVRRERRFGTIERTIALPGRIAADAISATCADGVLEVRVPRADPGVTPKEIPVQPVSA